MKEKQNKYKQTFLHTYVRAHTEKHVLKSCIKGDYLVNN